MGARALDKCHDGIVLERTDLLLSLANAHEEVWRSKLLAEKGSTAAAAWDGILQVDDMCFDLDDSFESMALMRLGGEHYFCEDSLLPLPPSPPSDSQTCPLSPPASTYTPQNQLADDNLHSISLPDILQYSQIPLQTALFVATEHTYPSTAKAACELHRTDPTIDITVAIDAEIADLSSLLECCSLAHVLLRSPLDLSSLPARHYSYADLGAGLLNLVPDPASFLTAVSSLLVPGGGIGMVVHSTTAVDSLQGTVASLKEQEGAHGDVLTPDLMAELYGLALKSSFGYSSDALLKQIGQLKNSFTTHTLAPLLGSVGLAAASLVGYGAGSYAATSPHIEAFASLPPPADQPGRNLNIVLGESSLIIPKATAILRAAERRLKRSSDPSRKLVFTLPAHGELAFPLSPSYMELLSMINENGLENSGNLHTLKDMYIRCNDEKNRKGHGMDALKMDEFMADAIQLVEILNEIGLVAVL
ncbi:hypothetical protein TeGR_g1352 [Tetraparma gracilis]|uniref:Uncharacterized protein n=1 Tax=Tetraparma gracilis TaxID=2962635 RepID=A0ABQ6NEY9_9STRA|nr:hypothetical protein TeGR_g1352 [Tetraparma gracilis]